MSKKQKKSIKKEEFNLTEAYEDVNPYLLEGFKKYLQGKEVKTRKQFDDYLKNYGG